MSPQAVFHAPTLLVVDDDEPSTATLEVALSPVSGVSIAIANSAEQALAMLERGLVLAAIITDVHLGGMDGLQLVKRVRADARYAGLPIIVISGDTDERAPHRAIAAGANAFFEKPFSPSRVRMTLERLLDEHSSHSSS